MGTKAEAAFARNSFGLPSCNAAQPAFVHASAGQVGAVHRAFHPCGPPQNNGGQGIRKKANKKAY
jgi:hypothetical protein